MTAGCKTVAVVSLVLGLAGRLAVGQETNLTCDEVISMIGEETTSISLPTDIICNKTINIASGAELTLDAGRKTIRIGTNTDFSSEQSALFYNQGTFTLKNAVIEETEEADGTIRAIYNAGTLTVLDTDVSDDNSQGDINYGGAIYSDSDDTVTIERCKFSKNTVSENGGAIYATGGGTLDVTDSVFSETVAGVSESSDITSAGGAIYTDPDVTLTVSGTTFSESSAVYGGGAIACCGGTVSNSTFSGCFAEGTDVTSYGGAILVGTPGENECTETFELSTSNFDTCTVSADTDDSAGGSVAMFNVNADIDDCTFETSEGTALVFESDSADGEHQIQMSSVQFNENSDGAEKYKNGEYSQGTAFVVQNTAVDENIDMGTMSNIYCFSNDPYECEVVLENADITEIGEHKCRMCDLDGNDIIADVNEDLYMSDSESSSSDNQGIVIGLSLALGLTLVVIGALAAWKIKVRKNARRLMEDMGDGDL